MTQIVAIANQKGGVGKTTTAVNLAAALALAGRSVLLIDLDPQANATSGVGAQLRPETSLHPLVADPQFPLRSERTRIERLDVLPASPALLQLEQEIGRHADAPTRLADCLRASTALPDFVIVDSPPSLGLLTINALNAATGVLVPIQSEYYAMEGLTRILSALDEVRQTTNPGLALAGILLTMFDPDVELCREVASEVHGYFPDEVYRTIIPRDVALSEAASYGQSAFDYAPRGPGALAYLELAKEVMSNG